MANTHTLDGPAMMRALKYVARRNTVVHLRDCINCGTPLIIAAVGNYRARKYLLPYTPKHSGWRAFERRLVHDPRAWRSSKRYGFIPSQSHDGFLPHDCPLADHKQPA